MKQVFKIQLIGITTLFLIIYNPPIIKFFSFTELFLFLSIFYFIINLNSIVHFLKPIKNFFIFILLFFIYYIIICIVNIIFTFDYLYIIIYEFLITLRNIISQLIISISLAHIACRINLSYTQFLKYFILCGFFQSILGLYSLINNNIKTFFLNLMIDNSNSEKIARTLQYTGEYRNFGFASTLYDIFGLTMSLLAIVTYNYAIATNYKKYYIYFSLLSIIAIINARTSIILILIGIVTILFQKNICRNLLTLISISTIISTSLFIILHFNESLEEWIVTGLNEIVNFIKLNNQGYFEILFNDFIFFPDDFLNTILGTALLPMQSIQINTDVGYIQNIWKYGILGSLIIYSSLILILNKSYKYSEPKFKNMTIAIAIILFIYLIKLNFWGYSMAGCVFLPILIYSSCYSFCFIDNRIIK